MDYGSFSSHDDHVHVHAHPSHRLHQQRSFLQSPSTEVKRRVHHEWTEHLDGFSTYHSQALPSSLADTASQKEKAFALLWDLFEVPTLLVLIGTCSAILSCLTNKCIAFVSAYRMLLISDLDNYQYYLCYILWSVSSSLLACFLSFTICKESAGSGLPEMKTILSGVIKPVLLSKQLIVAKILGLSFALIAGLSIGK
jgi:hypothetical protein